MEIELMHVTFGSPEYTLCVELRTRVLRTPLGLTFALSDLQKEYVDIHLAARVDGRLNACLILTRLSPTVCKMRQVAVDASFQGRGVGTELVAFSERVARDDKFTTMELNAREGAVPFYLKLGYQICGDRFEEVTIPHFKMTKKL